jgi:acyl-CoA synthetase (NDP forming)
VRSIDGPVNTLFIPGYKLPSGGEPADPVALVSQSGAFAVARVSALAPITPRVVATVGNQLDVTVGEYVRALADDPRIEVIAVYVEGFADGDGMRFLEGARIARASGKDVVLYRAGRNRSGKVASASHTASIAGEFEVTLELARAAGAMVAGTLEEFDDLVRLAIALRGRSGPGEGLVAISNAGFECVAMADHAGDWALIPPGPDAARRVSGVLDSTGIGEITRPANPLDLTPMMGAAGFAEVVEAMLADPSMAAGVVGCVPLTAALDTLPADDVHHEDLAAPDGLASRLGGLWRSTDRPWVAVVDSGSRYDPFARALAASGVPVFRHADRAVRALAGYLFRTRA